MNKPDNQKQTHTRWEQSGYQREKGRVGSVKSEGINCMEMNGRLTFGDEHTGVGTEI